MPDNLKAIQSLISPLNNKIRSDEMKNLTGSTQSCAMKEDGK